MGTPAHIWHQSARRNRAAVYVIIEGEGKKGEI